MATRANPTTRRNGSRPILTRRPIQVKKEDDTRETQPPVVGPPRKKEGNPPGTTAAYTNGSDLNNTSKWLAEGGGSGPSSPATQDRSTTKTAGVSPPSSSAQASKPTYAGLYGRRSQPGVVQRSNLSEGWWEGNGPYGDLARKAVATIESNANSKPADESTRTVPEDKKTDPDRQGDAPSGPKYIPANHEPRSSTSPDGASKPDGVKRLEKSTNQRSNVSEKWWKERHTADSALIRSSLPDSGAFGTIPRKEASPTGGHQRPSERVLPRAGPSQGQASKKDGSKEAPSKARPDNQGGEKGGVPRAHPRHTLSEVVAAQNYKIRTDSPFDTIKNVAASAPHHLKPNGQTQPCDASDPFVQQAWNDKAVFYDIDESQKWHKDFAFDIISRLSPRKGSRVLDLGCGTGLVTLRAAKVVGPAGTVIGVDFSAGMLDELKKKKTRSKAYKNVVAIEHDVTCLESLPDVQDVKQKNGGFDIITCISCLDYIADPRAAIKDWARLLVPGGRIVIDMPAIEERLSSTFDMIIKTLRPDEQSSPLASGITEVVSLANAFKSAGLEVQEKWCTRDYNGGRICYTRDEGEEILQAEIQANPVLRTCDAARVRDMWWQLWNINVDEQGDYYDRFKRWVMVANKRVGADNSRAQIKHIEQQAANTRKRVGALRSQAQTILNSIKEKA